MKTKILWLAPNMNHYKSRFLNHLAVDESIDLSVFSGAGRQKMGDEELKGDWSFKQLNIDVPKKEFGTSKLVTWDKSKQTFFSKQRWIIGDSIPFHGEPMENSKIHSYFSGEDVYYSMKDLWYNDTKKEWAYISMKNSGGWVKKKFLSDYSPVRYFKYKKFK